MASAYPFARAHGNLHSINWRHHTSRQPSLRHRCRTPRPILSPIGASGPLPCSQRRRQTMQSSQRVKLRTAKGEYEANVTRCLKTLAHNTERLLCLKPHNPHCECCKRAKARALMHKRRLTPALGVPMSELGEVISYCPHGYEERPENVRSG